MNLDLSKIKNVHFIGIGGIGISAVARMMLSEGKKVTGQDMQEGEVVDELRKIGIEVEIGQSFGKIPEDTDLIIYTIAIEYYDPELFKKLQTEETLIRSYPEMLNIISKDKYTIAIAGTHGKTTTTAMIAKVLKDTSKDPTVIVGSLLEDSTSAKATAERSKTNYIKGDSNYFVVEACEYRRSFLNINPKILVITNIDKDHLDYYKDIEDIKSAFRELVLKVPSDGFIICNPDDENISDVIKNIPAKIINYQEFFNENLKLKIPGNHNKKDAAAAVSVASLLDISQLESEKSLEGFLGTWRRFEYKGKLENGTLIYDDYAHHPVEIMATLESFKELYPNKKITIVFQPHLYSRTKILFDEFSKSFSLADKVLVLPIYFAREESDGTISSDSLVEEINKHNNIPPNGTGQVAESFSDFESLEKYLEAQLPSMDDKNIIVTMGAGEAFKIGDFLLKNSIIK